MQINDEFILDIKRLGINGEGIGFYKKMAVFVPNAIPGEGVNVRVTDVKNNMAFAEVIERDFGCAEDALDDLEPVLGMQEGQSLFSIDTIEDDAEGIECNFYKEK